MTNGGVMIGQYRHHLQQAGVALAAALDDEREHEAEQRRDDTDDRCEQRRIDRDAAARAAAEAPKAPDVRRQQPFADEPRRKLAPRVEHGGNERAAHRIEDEHDQQRRDDDDDRRDRDVGAEPAEARERASETYGERGERERCTDAERGSVARRDEALREPPREAEPGSERCHARAAQPAGHEHHGGGDEQRTKRDRRRVARPFGAGHDEAERRCAAVDRPWIAASAPIPTAAISAATGS
jgi:hypothetical protein